jgi:nitrogen fixation protein NifU and related proteins
VDLYADNILDHYRNPRCNTAIGDPSIKHEEKNLSCGDALEVSLRIEEGKVTAASWQGTGCAISQAAMSMVSEELVGKKEEEILSMPPSHVYELLGVPVGPRRHKCALLCLHALKNAIHTLRAEPVQSWVETVAIEN